MKGLNDLVRQAQIMQKKMGKLQEELALKQVEASAGGGMVSVTCTGAMEITSIRIDKAAVDPSDVDMLQDLILAAVNEALKKSKAMAQEEMGALTGGMQLPGLF